MLTVKVEVRPSRVQGLGVFALEKIPAGTITWKFDPAFDIRLDKNILEQLPAQQAAFVHHFAYLSTVSQQYVLPVDDARFMNHSSQPNIDCQYTPGDLELHDVANRDIQVGEELVINYRVFDQADAVSTEAYLQT